MKLEHEFIQLPYLFDEALLQQEMSAFQQADWRPHHEGFKGNFSVPLVSVNGTLNNEFKGNMALTPYLKNTPYLHTVISSFNEVVGRTRLMGLAPGAEVPVHSDINYHWYNRVRIHVPIVTAENVIFHCGDQQVNMKAGEAWIFDSWKYHKVVNNSEIFRVHLVIDVCGSSQFWDKVDKGSVLNGPQVMRPEDIIRVDKINPQPIATEKFNVPLVMSPGEMDGLARDLFSELRGYQKNDPVLENEFINIVKNFCRDWRVLWSQYGHHEKGYPKYHELRSQAYQKVHRFDNDLLLVNGTQAPRMFLFCMLDAALNTEVRDDFFSAAITTVEQSRSSDPQSRSREVSDTPAKTPKNGFVTRNSPCPCGSGKKYKSCHGKL